MSGDIGYGPALIGRFGSKRGGGERIANIVFTTLQALEEPEELIAWVITGRSALGSLRTHFTEDSFLSSTGTAKESTMSVPLRACAWKNQASVAGGDIVGKGR